VVEADRDRLVKILRMFSSDHDGEVAAAARRAHKLLKDRSLDWDDLIISVASSANRQNRTKSFEEQFEEAMKASEANLIRKCAERERCLTTWENEFIVSIGASILEWGKLTPKQRAVLDRIVTKLKLAGVWDDL
jgi:hypothetical protein